MEFSIDKLELNSKPRIKKKNRKLNSSPFKIRKSTK